MRQPIWHFLSLLLLTAFTLSPAQETSTSSTELQVESIQISGNSKTREAVIRSFLLFREGERVTRTQVTESRQALTASNFFKEVNLYTQPGSRKGQVQVFVEVRERHWPFFQFKSGYSELDGWYVSPLGLRFDNFFGRGNQMGAEFFIGDRLSGLDIGYRRPNFMDSDLDLGLKLFVRNRDFVHYIGGTKYIHPVANSGVGLRLSGNQGLLKYFVFELNREAFEAADSIYLAGHRDEKRLPPEMLQPFSERKEVGRFILSFYADTRDQRFYPLRGWWGSLSLNQVSTELGAFTDYKKVIFDVRRYQPLLQGWVLAGQARGGWIDDSAPFYEKFYLGGPNSLRGYKDRSLNPLGYASRLLQGSVELRFPITRKKFPRHFISGVFFYDLGEAWSEPQKLRGANLKSSVGFGFRFKLPLVGLLRVDFAYPVPDYEFKLHVSLGHTF